MLTSEFNISVMHNRQFLKLTKRLVRTLKCSTLRSCASKWLHFYLRPSNISYCILYIRFQTHLASNSNVAQKWKAEKALKARLHEHFCGFLTAISPLVYLVYIDCMDIKNTATWVISCVLFIKLYPITYTRMRSELYHICKQEHV